MHWGTANDSEKWQLWFCEILLPHQVAKRIDVSLRWKSQSSKLFWFLYCLVLILIKLQWNFSQIFISKSTRRGIGFHEKLNDLKGNLEGQKGNKEDHIASSMLEDGTRWLSGWCD